MNERSESLDLLRGLAALLVMLGHLRSIFFVPFNELSNPNLFFKGFYFFTGYGHECVMVFFVLSGYFVGAAFHKNFQSSNITGHVANYSLNRMSRLWMVLVPALVFTAVIDILGLTLAADKAMYSSSDYFQFIHPSNDRSVLTFFGNVFFLQTIEVPTFGTNTPLWSLANEFWYYLLFPLLYLILHKNSSLRLRILLTVLTITISYWLVVRNSSIAEGFLIWLMGFAATLVSFKPSIVVRVGLIGFFLAVFVAARAQIVPFGDIALGISTFGLIVAVRDLGLGWLGSFAVFLSKISYTLYLVHLPLVIFLSATIFHGYILRNDVSSLALFLGLVIFVVAFSYGMYFIFERNTDKVRRFLKRKLMPASS